MASTFTGINVNTLASTGQQPKQYQIGDNVTIYKYALAAALVVGDVINMQTLPANTFVSGITLDVPKLDSGGTATIILAVGTTGTPGLFIASSTIAQTGGLAYMSVAGSVGATFNTNQQVVVKCATAPQTGIAAGTVTLNVNYTVDP